MADAPAGWTPVGASKVPANFWTKAVVVVVLGLLVVYLLWVPLGFPAKMLNLVASGIGPKECSQYSTGTSQMKTCATTVGAKKVVGPLIIGLVMLVLRKQVSKGMGKIASSRWLAKAESALGAPLLKPIVPALTALVLFTMGWAAVHDATKGSPGLPLFNQQRFPVLVGLFTLASSHYGPAVQRAAAGFFRSRDKVGLTARIVLVTVASIVVSYLVMTQTQGSSSYLANPGRKEQGIVLFSLVLGWVMLTPVAKPTATATHAAPAHMGVPTPAPEAVRR